MKKVRTFLLRGKRWGLDLTRRKLTIDGKPKDGICDYDRQKIRVRDDLDPERRLDVIIHEVLHAAYPDLHEGPIEETATDLANLLRRLGYRQAI